MWPIRVLIKPWPDLFIHSLTVLITLFSLFCLGGATTRDFVLAMLIGIISGTYSSIFNASCLLVYWRELKTGRKTKFA